MHMLAVNHIFATLYRLPELRFRWPVRKAGPRNTLALGSSQHLLRDIGMDDYLNPADDPRWRRRIDLER